VEIFSRKIRAAFLLDDEEKFLSSSEIINATGVVQESSQPSAISSNRCVPIVVFCRNQGINSRVGARVFLMAES
jgi:hypothetical protein